MGDPPDLAGPAEQFDLFGGDGEAVIPSAAADGIHKAPSARGIRSAPAATRGEAPGSGAGEAGVQQASFAGLDVPSHEAPAATHKRRGTPQPKGPGRGAPVAAPDFDDTLIALGEALPGEIHLGTSTWSFPGWRGLVYRDEISDTKLSREGLHAYGQHPVLGCVGIDRSFYAPLTVAQYARHAAQVPETFRFVVKAPASVCDAAVRGPRGGALAPNPMFLNATLARDEFVIPCLEGLGRKAGALVFQLSPMTPPLLADPASLIERLGEFFSALPPLDTYPGEPVYAVEIRDASLLTPRFIRMLRETKVRYCVGIHARMPDPLRQAAALALLDDESPGPLVIRWSLHAGFEYETAKAKYAPFDRLVDEDPNTREALAELAARYAIAGQPVFITVNNKAEGSAPISCVKLAEAILATLANLAEPG